MEVGLEWAGGGGGRHGREWVADRVGRVGRGVGCEIQMVYVRGGGRYRRGWVVGWIGRGVGLGVGSEIQMVYVEVERSGGGGGRHGSKRVADGVGRVEWGVGREIQMVYGGGGGRCGRGWGADWVWRGVGLGHEVPLSFSFLLLIQI
jgi:hypothetical protein